MVGPDLHDWNQVELKRLVRKLNTECAMIDRAEIGGPTTIVIFTKPPRYVEDGAVTETTIEDFFDET